MMNSRWQANKIGLINFWYYDEQEFSFVKGRMLLRGSNGSGKSVTMQSVVPLLLDGNMSPERLDPFGSRDRKMSSYLLEEDDGREERTGYLYLELKRQNSDTYLTIGMGIRARRGKNLDKWYFSLTDGRRIGKDFFLYKDSGEKVTLSKKELENRIGDGGRVIDRQVDYMEYVNRQIFGFETTEEYKEMIDLLIQLRTPKLSKDFKPSVINDILSDSLQPLSDDDLRPMSEAIENMDTMTMNLKNRKEARQAAEKIQAVFSKYNQKLLYEKAERCEQAGLNLENARTRQNEQEKKLCECRKKIEALKIEHQQLDVKRESMEKEKESLNKSDAVALKRREAELITELNGQQKNLGSILTNAAGGVNLNYRPGDVMVISDHIKLNGASPLRGQNVEDFGERFFDTTRMYTPELRALALRCAEGSGLRVHEGVYFFMPGPQFETPAEIRAIRALGGDAVGMSTVTEALTAAHCGLPLLGISVITNLAAGMTGAAVTGEEVNETGAAVAGRFSRYLTKIVEEMDV